MSDFYHFFYENSKYSKTMIPNIQNKILSPENILTESIVNNQSSPNPISFNTLWNEISHCIYSLQESIQAEGETSTKCSNLCRQYENLLDEMADLHHYSKNGSTVSSKSFNQKPEAINHHHKKLQNDYWNTYTMCTIY